MTKTRAYFVALLSSFGFLGGCSNGGVYVGPIGAHGNATLTVASTARVALIDRNCVSSVFAGHIHSLTQGRHIVTVVFSKDNYGAMKMLDLTFKEGFQYSIDVATTSGANGFNLSVKENGKVIRNERVEAILNYKPLDWYCGGVLGGHVSEGGYIYTPTYYGHGKWY